MCDFISDSKRRDKELLQSLKDDQLFSVEILVEEIVVTHGPYKNAGDLDNITETESEDSEEEVEEEAAPEESLTVGMTLLEDPPGEEGTVKSASAKSRAPPREPPPPRVPPKIKQKCHTIPIDSWPPGVISSKAYVAPFDEYPWDPYDGPLQLCTSCKDKCKGVKPEKMKKCECPKEICYRFPIDSWGPGIRSSSGIERTKCVCTATVEKPPSRKGRPKSAKSTDSKGDKKNKGKGKDKGKKESKKESKKKILEEVIGDIDEGDQTLMDKEPKKPKKKKNKRCKRPPKPEGPLPPIRVTISAFQINDIKIHQVDLEKLYPPEDENAIIEEESEPKIPIEEEQEVEIKETVLKEKVKKTDAKKTPGKTKDKGKPSSSKGSVKSSASSKQSRNIVKPAKDKRPAKGAGDGQIDAASSIPADTTEASDDQDHSPLYKYRGLGGADAPKCSGDLEARLKEVGKERRHDHRRRKEVIESLRACTEFMRGVSLLFASTPLDIITWLLVEKLEIQVDRCAPYGPVYPIGTVKLRLPGVLRDRVQAGARRGRRRALWSCLQDKFPIIDCKGQHVGDLSLYLCLSSLGRALVSTSLASDSNLYQYTNSACYIGSAQPHRATAFTTRYNNLHRLTMKHYDLPNPPLLLSPNIQ